MLCSDYKACFLPRNVLCSVCKACFLPRNVLCSVCKATFLPLGVLCIDYKASFLPPGVLCIDYKAIFLPRNVLCIVCKAHHRLHSFPYTLYIIRARERGALLCDVIHPHNRITLVAEIMEFGRVLRGCGICAEGIVY